MTRRMLRLVAAVHAHRMHAHDVANVRQIEAAHGEWPTFFANNGANLAWHRLRYRLRVTLLVRARLAGDDTPAYILLYDHPPTEGTTR